MYKLFHPKSHFCMMNKLGLVGEERRIGRLIKKKKKKGRDPKYLLVNKYTKYICHRSGQT